MPVRLSPEARNALKAAIAAAPGWPEYKSRVGKNTGAMSKDELLTAARDLGIDLQTLNVNAAPDTQETDTQEDETPAQPETESADTIARDILAGNIAGLEDRIKALAVRALTPVVREVSIEKIVYQPAPKGEASAVALTSAAPAVSRMVGRKTLAEVFGISARSALGKKLVEVWDCPLSPAVDPDFLWNEDTLLDILAAHSAPRWRDRHIWVYGPRGTGKTSLAEQFAARTGRPFARINFDMATETPDLFGGMGLRGGNTLWQDGGLTAACRLPGCVILLDEPTVARPGALMALNPVLDNGAFTIKETGEVVSIAAGVTFFAGDNTNGLEDPSGQYAGTAAVNAAFLDRFAKHLEISWLDAKTEAAAVAARSGCKPALAEKLVTIATVTRQRQEAGELVSAIGPRRLIALAVDLTFGIGARRAWQNCILNGTPGQDREIYAQIASAHYPAAEIETLASDETPQPAPKTATPQGAAAANAFANAPASNV